MTRILKTLLCLLLSFTFIIPLNHSSIIHASSKTENTIQSDYEVAYTGDFSKIISGYIVIYPKDLTTSNQKWPVIVWANGTACAPGLYWNALCALASKGYVVVASSETMSASGDSQIQQVDYILSENSNSDSIFYNKIDTNKIGAAGHSQGGRSTVNAAKKDSRIKASVSIAGSNTSSERTGNTTPTLFLTGTLDLVVLSSMWVKPTYNKAEGPAAYASLVGGIHTSVITNYERIIYYTAKWMDAYLKDDQNAKRIFMSGGELYQDSSWRDVTSKGITLSPTATIIGNGNILLVVLILCVLIAVALINLKRKKRVI